MLNKFIKASASVMRIIMTGCVIKINLSYANAKSMVVRTLIKIRHHIKMIIS